MLLRLQKGLLAEQVEAVLALARELGYRTRFLDERSEILLLDGAGRPEHRSKFEDLASVKSVLDAGDARERHERDGRADTVVRVGDARFGGGFVSLIAGPCAVEDGDRLVDIAREVQRLGATLLRGGAWKPRTSPYSFQGLRAEGLARLAEAKAATGIGIVTEVLDPRDIAAIGEVADMFQIGARSMTNSTLLVEVGRTKKPVLLKRGLQASVREFLLAAEFILAQGNTQVVLCERGIRGFDTTTRNLLDVGAVAHLKRATHLPVIVDPSHAAGRSELVRPLARAGLAAGADGLIVEVHPDPSEVHSDGSQAVSPETFAQIVADSLVIAALDEKRVVLPEPVRATR
ncbi:MAG: 3-deoxy-7-phosphoheptulonate synthase [Planctomycetes bacterium]|nr:3-deoxy-7-phosphoheptulonate synthase [Planctomycetota bacterium]